MIQHESHDNEDEGRAEVGVEVEIEDENGEEGGDQHGAGDQKEASDVAAVFHDGRHDEPTQRLHHMTQLLGTLKMVAQSTFVV